MLKKGDKVGIVCCSNAMNKEYDVSGLVDKLISVGLIPVLSEFIYMNDNGLYPDKENRAGELNRFCADDSVKAIFDISGGDMANEILELIDYEIIKKTDKLFFGYSDLTVIINAIYSLTYKPSVLYQVRNLIYKDEIKQTEDFINSMFYKKNDLFDFEYDFIRGNNMEGVVLGGNIRCLLKLAGTKYFPDFKNKILLLEGYRGQIPQLVTYFSHLKQLNIFGMVNGIILGTFSEMEDNGINPKTEQLILSYIPEHLPICITKEIGHRPTSKAIIIGKYLKLYRDE